MSFIVEPVINPALTAKFDFPVPTKPTMFYVVASTPRSGSTYLCYRLWETGLLGAPQEYFNFNSLMLEMAVRLAMTNIHDYVRRVFELRTSPNGVFAFKAHWSHFRLLELADVDMLGYFPRLRFIHIERRDKVAQAVSEAKRQQTNRSETLSLPDDRRLAYDFGRIQGALARIERESARWHAMFRRSGIEPIRVTYESLVADPDAVVDDVLRRFGFARDPARCVEAPKIARLSDSTNLDWIDRFRRDAAAR